MLEKVIQEKDDVEKNFQETIGVMEEAEKEMEVLEEVVTCTKAHCSQLEK